MQVFLEISQVHVHNIKCTVSVSIYSGNVMNIHQCFTCAMQFCVVEHIAGKAVTENAFKIFP